MATVTPEGEEWRCSDSSTLESKRVSRSCVVTRWLMAPSMKSAMKPTASPMRTLRRVGLALTETSRGALTRLASLLFAVPGWGLHGERIDQTAGNHCHVIDRSIERGFVGVRWLRRATEFPDELQRRRANLVVGRGRLEVGQGLDVSTHDDSPELQRPCLSIAGRLVRRIGE